MCTLTWLRNHDGYTLVFNRDELKTRQRALAPETYRAANGVAYLAPIDTDAGGTWLATNELGITICLLNDYSSPEPKVAQELIQSRGEVVTMLAGTGGLEEVEHMLSSLNLKSYRGFRVVAFADGVHQWRWNTQALEKLCAKQTRNPITSSSFDEADVQKTRRAYYSAFGESKNLEDLLNFHSSHIDDDLCDVSSEPLAVSSVCMHRRYSQTVSQCLVKVCEKQVEIIYTDGAPCATKANPPVFLERVATIKKMSAIGNA